MQIEASRRGYAFAAVRPRGDRNFEAHTVSIVFAIDEGRADLHRAHQHTRQYPYAGLRDPPRIRRVRGRCLQPCAGRSVRAPPEESRLLQEREDQHRAGVFKRPRDPRGGSGREIHRRLLGVRRLLDLRRRAGRGQYLRAQFPRPRHVREGIGAVRPVCARRFAVLCRAVFVRLSRRRRSRPVLSRAARQQLRLLQYQDDGFQPAARLRSARRFVPAAALFAVSDVGLAAARAEQL